MIASRLALISATAGVLFPHIYDPVVTSEIMSGIFSQDLITIVLSGVALFLAANLKSESLKKQVVILGLIGYFFYGYGIYVIEQIYTPVYLLYMAIFGLADYSIIYGLISLKDTIPKMTPTKSIRFLSIAFLIITL